MMWTLIFCVGTGAWLWYGELVVLHVAVALGVLITGLTFRRASGEIANIPAVTAQQSAGEDHSAVKWTGF